jgi:hypothetical protein
MVYKESNIRDEIGSATVGINNGGEISYRLEYSG